MVQVVVIKITSGFSDTKKYHEANGYDIWWPLLPNTDKPDLKETRNFVEQNLPAIDEDTIIIGHSSACPLILHMLQFFKVKIKQVLLVDGFYQSLGDDGYSDIMLPNSFDWPEIKLKADNFLFINSNNDPGGCNDKQARPVAIELGATLVVATGQGHMGSTSYNQPYKEFPLLKRLLEVGE